MKIGPSAPSLPPPGHKSHRNTISVRPERYRKLETIYRYQTGPLDAEVNNFIKATIPAMSIPAVEDEDDATGERISVPSAVQFAIDTPRFGRPSDIHRFSHCWIDALPLETVQRIMHLVFPACKQWKISSHADELDIDNDLFNYFTWGRDDPRDPAPRPSVIIFVQPPWILSQRDLELFVKCNSFPVYFEARGVTLRPLQSKERLWGKLWDICAAQKCHYFVVSTYTGWVFGNFSEGWTTGFVSYIKSFDQKAPTVLETLVYWFASSMDMLGCKPIPKVSEPIVRAGSDSSIAVCNQTRYQVAPSESSWSGKNSAGSSAGLDPYYLSPVLTYTSQNNKVGISTSIMEPTTHSTLSPQTVKKKVQLWQSGQQGEHCPATPSTNPTPTPTESVWSDPSHCMGSEAPLVTGHYLLDVVPVDNGLPFE